MPEDELLDIPDLPEFETAPGEDPPSLPSSPPAGLDTALYESDQRPARRDLRRQIAAMEAALGRLFGSAFPRTGIQFGVSAPGGPRVLSVDELERVRDSLAARIQEVRAELDRRGRLEEGHRELIERMSEDPAAHKWVRVSNGDIGEPGCRSWHSRPRWGLLGMLLGWWRLKVSSGCPLAAGVAPPASEPRRDRDGEQAPAPQEAPPLRAAGVRPRPRS